MYVTAKEPQIFIFLVVCEYKVGTHAVLNTDLLHNVLFINY